MPLELLLAGSGSRRPLAVPWHRLEMPIRDPTFFSYPLCQVLFGSSIEYLHAIPGISKSLRCGCAG